MLSGKDKIPLDENLLLREIKLKSVGENMDRYFLHHNDTLKIFSTIRLEYQERFTTSIRDKIWSTISVGSECPDIDAVDRMLTKMLLQEQYANPPEEKYRARNEFINGKILKSMCENLTSPLIDYHYFFNIEDRVSQYIIGSTNISNDRRKYHSSNIFWLLRSKSPEPDINLTRTSFY